MASFKINFDTKELERELNKQFQKIVEEEQFKLDMEDSQEINGMKILDTMLEEALKIILEHYDGNEDNCVDGDYDWFPRYMQHSFKDIFTKLKIAGVIASSVQYIGGWGAYLTPNGKTYFEDKKNYLNRSNKMFDKLPSNSRILLKDILEADEPAEMLAERFENCTDKEDGYLRAMIRELIEKGLIEVQWADNVPYYMEINNSGITYFERESEYEKMQKQSQGTTVNINTLNATGSNIVFGDSNNSTFNIDNSIKELEKKIENDIDKLGGDDKEELKELFEEAKELIENIKLTRQVPKNKGFFKRLNEHVVKHGWFYGAILQLMGTEALALLAK